MLTDHGLDASMNPRKKRNVKRNDARRVNRVSRVTFRIGCIWDVGVGPFRR